MKNKQKIAEKKSQNQAPRQNQGRANAPREIGGPKGPEPTRYGDWERRGRCCDF
ncbi:MAG: succinate dehydrogenase assembly factor 4 [Gammaproteobacteria bacterium]